MFNVAEGDAAENRLGELAVLRAADGPGEIVGGVDQIEAIDIAAEVETEAAIGEQVASGRGQIIHIEMDNIVAHAGVENQRFVRVKHRLHRQRGRAIIGTHRRAGHIAHRDPRIRFGRCIDQQEVRPAASPCEFVGQIGHILNDDRISTGTRDRGRGHRGIGHRHVDHLLIVSPGAHRALPQLLRTHHRHSHPPSFQSPALS